MRTYCRHEDSVIPACSVCARNIHFSADVCHKHPPHHMLKCCHTTITALILVWLQRNLPLVRALIFVLFSLSKLSLVYVLYYLCTSSCGSFTSLVCFLISKVFFFFTIAFIHSCYHMLFMKYCTVRYYVLSSLTCHCVSRVVNAPELGFGSFIERLWNKTLFFGELFW